MAKRPAVLVVLALVVVLFAGLLQGSAAATTYDVNYNIKSYSPRNAGTKLFTRMAMSCYSEGSEKAWSETIYANNRSTVFKIGFKKRSGGYGFRIVARDKFYRWVDAHDVGTSSGDCEVIPKWKWSRDAHHHRFKQALVIIVAPYAAL